MDSTFHSSNERDHIPMMRTMTVVRQYIAAAFLILIGLSAYGCGSGATVSPVVELSSLSVTTETTTSALQPAFSSAITDYTVQLSSSVTSVTVTAKAAVDGDSVSINDQTTTSRAITLAPAGQTTVVNIVVSETGTNSRTYTVKLVRAGLDGNNSLKSLSVSPGTLNPAFTADEQFYRVDAIKSTDTKVTLTPTLDDVNATMTVDGQDTASGQGREITLKPAGQTTIVEIFVKAQNGQVKQYHVEVPREISGNNDLKTLTMLSGSSGTSNLPLDPSFKASITDYKVAVGSGVTSVRVTPTLDDPTATMTVNGLATTTGQAQPITLRAAGLITLITIRVTAPNGTPKIYTVDVDRADLSGINNLSGLTVSPGTWDSAFSATDLSYTVNVGSSVERVKVTPTLPPNSNASLKLSVNSGPLTNINSGVEQTITLGPPDSNTFINIIVIAQNGSKNTYVVAVDRAPSNDNNLSALSVRVGTAVQTLSPVFARSILTYTVDVASNVDKVTVLATKSDRNAAMAIDGAPVPPGTETGQAPVKLGGQGSETPVSITVTPQIGSPKTYSLTITRLSSNTNLSALSVTAGTAVLPLSPPFNSNKVNVATDITSVTVTATLEDTNATMTINGQGTSSGVASAPITLGAQGSNTNIPIVVIAPNGTQKEYTITVNRAAPATPPTPTDAPDLIKADDSCPLLEPPDPLNNPDPDGCAFGTSRSDNVTNKTTLGFSIPSPGAGVTPKLYVNGVKDDNSTFTQGILRRSTPFDDGTYTITYTLTNAGGESLESPPLCDELTGKICTVTIDTRAPGN